KQHELLTPPIVGAVYDRPPATCDIVGGHRPPLQCPTCVNISFTKEGNLPQCSGFFFGCSKAITYSMNRLNVCGLFRFCLNFFADPADIDVHTARRHCTVTPPHAIEQLIPGKDHSRI